MSTLRVRHYESSGDRFVELSFSESVSLGATHPFSPELDRFDLEDLRWYHENYLTSWYVSSNAVVERIKRADLKIGKALYRSLFGPASHLALAVRESLAELRVEIHDEVPGAAIPWESIADEQTGERLALRSRTFVRSVVGTDMAKQHTANNDRLLLVICRPDGILDISYWSVAYAIWETLKDIPNVKVDVLRPPTFEALEKYLVEAKDTGRPYAAVHFDGHGVIVDPFGGSSPRGYLVFESADGSDREFIDGVTIGRVLVANAVSHLSMNACRSADSQGGDRHLLVKTRPAIGQPSIVDQVLGEGLFSCIGMRREIYPASAKRFFNSFYPAFFSGQSAADATKIARNALANNPLEANVFDASIEGIDDWSIPVVGERQPVCLGFAPATKSEDGSDDPIGQVPSSLSWPSLVGFDDQILSLETHFVDRKPVHIYGPVLAGKSRLAVEYAKWYSTTSVRPCPIFYVRLFPRGDATSVLQSFQHSIGRSFETAAGCADHLRTSGGVVILDQADAIAADAKALLVEVLNKVGSACRVIVTSRGPNLDWLPDHSKLRPSALFRSKRAELAQRWAEETGNKFNVSDYYPLLFFSGGFPGVLLLLVSCSYKLISRGKASAREIAHWLHACEWPEITKLSPHSWPDQRSIEVVVSDIVADIVATCDLKTVRLLPLLSRFQVCLDLDSAVRLVREVQRAASAVPDQQTVETLESAGLLTPVRHLRDPTWLLHPLLKVVVSRLPEVINIERDQLDHVFVDTIQEKCASLNCRYRHDTDNVIDELEFFEQNFSESLQIALQKSRIKEAVTLATTAGLYYRHIGNIEKMSGCFNHVLPYLVDNSGAVRLTCRNVAMPVWDLAIWLAPDWPRNRGMRPPVVLFPPKDDFYAIGLWHRSNRRYGDAATAFLRELKTRSSAARYGPGDIEHQLSEMVYDASDPQTWSTALEYAQKSLVVRNADDAIGLSASRISEARIRMVQILNQERYRVLADDLTARIQILPEDLLQLDGVEKLLREVKAIRGGSSAENKSQVAMISGRIALARGDLTSAVASFHEGGELMIEMQESSLWHHYHVFSLELLHHGWIARSHEFAVNAFQFAMHSGDFLLPTRLREFCERLEAAYPDLKNE